MLCSKTTNKKYYTIDGNDFSDLSGFAKVFSSVVLKNHIWKGNLDAFNDILRGGFGTPDEGFILVWKNSDKSKNDLGYEETEKWYEQHSKTCHPSNLEQMIQGMEKARNRQGDTIFDWLVEIIKHHGPGGSDSEDNVILKLE